jgi:hypothetical protein
MEIGKKSAIYHQLNVQFSIRMIFAWQSEIAIANDWQNTKSKAQVALDGSRPKLPILFIVTFAASKPNGLLFSRLLDGM